MFLSKSVTEHRALIGEEMLNFHPSGSQKHSSTGKAVLLRICSTLKLKDGDIESPMAKILVTARLNI